MPEFRFRRKKAQNRRTTVSNVEETSRQIEAAKQMMKPVPEGSRSPEEPLTNGAGGKESGISKEIVGHGVNGNTPEAEAVAVHVTTEEPITKTNNKEEGAGKGAELVEEEEESLREQRLTSFLQSSRGDRKRSSFMQEREKFFELLKAKYPEQACSLDIGLSSSEEGVGVAGAGDLSMFRTKPRVKEVNGVSGGISDQQSHSDGGSAVTGSGTGADNVVQRDDDEDSEGAESAEVRAIMSDKKLEEVEETSPDTLPEPPRNYGECLYLRHGKSLRHCPMPSPITLSTIKNLFLNMFDLNPAFFSAPSSSGPQIYLQDRKTKMWNRLDNVSMVTDHCTLLLADSALSHTSSNPASQTDSDINMPLEHLSQLTPLETSPKFDINGDTTPTEKRNGLWRSGHTHLVQNLSTLPDTLQLQKNPPSLLPHTYPSPSSFSSSASASSSRSPLSPSSGTPTQGEKVLKDKVLSQARKLQLSLADLRADLSHLRQTHNLKMAEVQSGMSHVSQRIVEAVLSFGRTATLSSRGAEDVTATPNSNAHWRRSEVSALRESYVKCTDSTLHHLEMLERAVEEMRVDVVRRRCRVVEEEVNVLTSSVSSTTDTIQDIKTQFQPLKDKMNSLMEAELKVLVQEEEFVKEESLRLEEATEKCGKLMKTLLTMLQYASLQSQRTPPNLNFPTVRNPDRGAVIENIGAISPNTAARMESIAKAEALRTKKKELSKSKMVGIRAFEEELKAKKKQLLKSGDFGDLENRRQVKTKAQHAEEKYRAGLGRDAVQEKGKGLPGGDRSQLREKEVVKGERRNASSESGKRKSFEEDRKTVGRELNPSVERDLIQISKVEKKSTSHQKDFIPDPPKVLSSRSHQWRSQDKSSVSKPQQPRPHPDVAAVLVQEPVHSQASQDSHASLPIKLTRSAGSMSTSHSPLRVHPHDGQAYSNSQPEYFDSSSFEPVHPQGRHNRRQPRSNDIPAETKRKSIGYLGEFSEVDVYYDTLQRKKRVASKDSGLSLPNSTASDGAPDRPRVAAKSVGDYVAYKPSINEAISGAGNGGIRVNNVSTSSSLSPGLTGGGGGNGIKTGYSGTDDPNSVKTNGHQPQKRPSSLVSTSSGLSYPASLRKNLADANPKRKSSPGDVNAFSAEFSSQLRRPAMRAPQPPPMSAAQGSNSTYSRLAVPSSSKKSPQGNLLPSRYGRPMGDQYHSATGSPKMSREAPQAPATPPRTNSSHSSPPKARSVVTGNSELNRRDMMGSSGNISSTSGEIVSKSSRLPFARAQNFQQQKDHLANIFDSDTLPVSQKKDDKRSKESQVASPSSVLKSSHASRKSTLTGTDQPKKSKINLFGKHKDSQPKQSQEAQRNLKRQSQQLSSQPQKMHQYHQVVPAQEQQVAAAGGSHHLPHPQSRPHQAPYSSQNISQHVRSSHSAGPGVQAGGSGQHDGHQYQHLAAAGKGNERPPVIGREKITSSYPGRLEGPQRKPCKTMGDTSLPVLPAAKTDEEKTQQQILRHPRLHHVSGIPMRPSKSAQQPFHPGANEPLSSYPRTQTSVPRMRSSSNGQVTKVSHDQPSSSLNFSRPAGGTSRGGGGAAGKAAGGDSSHAAAPPARLVGGAAYTKIGRYGSGMENNHGAANKGIMVGSLV